MSRRQLTGSTNDDHAKRLRMERHESASSSVSPDRGLVDDGEKRAISPTHHDQQQPASNLRASSPPSTSGGPSLSQVTAGPIPPLEEGNRHTTERQPARMSDLAISHLSPLVRFPVCNPDPSFHDFLAAPPTQNVGAPPVFPVAPERILASQTRQPSPHSHVWEPSVFEEVSPPYQHMLSRQQEPDTPLDYSSYQGYSPRTRPSAPNIVARPLHQHVGHAVQQVGPVSSSQRLYTNIGGLQNSSDSAGCLGTYAGSIQQGPQSFPNPSMRSDQPIPSIEPLNVTRDNNLGTSTSTVLDAPASAARSSGRGSSLAQPIGSVTQGGASHHSSGTGHGRGQHVQQNAQTTAVSGTCEGHPWPGRCNECQGCTACGHSASRWCWHCTYTIERSAAKAMKGLD